MWRQFVLWSLVGLGVPAVAQLPGSPSGHTVEGNPAAQQLVLRTDTLAVAGRCKHCKKRIEEAVQSLPGVHHAVWEISSQRLIVTYEPERLSRRQIQEHVAALGHDTEDVPATDEAYGKLPKCCRYRPQ